MQCSSPLYTYYSDYITTENGKKKLFFIDKDHFDNFEEKNGLHKLLLNCGHCIECRVNRAQDWSTRAMLESRYYSSNWFITLTYDDSTIPLIRTISRKSGQPMVLGQLKYDHFQKFMKDLREYYRVHFNITNIRFLVCGEYGDKSERCHFHVLLFNIPIDQRDLHQRKILGGHIYYDSPFIMKFWPYGNNIITDLNLCTASYVARYVVKKFYGHYEDCYNEVCRLHGVEPLKAEFIQTSRRPGIAHEYFSDQFKFQDFLYNKKILFDRGKLNPIPNYFKRIFKDKPEEISNFEDFTNFNLDSQDVLDIYSTQKFIEQDLNQKQILKHTSLSLEDYQRQCHDLYENSLFSRNTI